jgi:DNA-binding MarR family transcriptional regulator
MNREQPRDHAGEEHGGPRHARGDARREPETATRVWQGMRALVLEQHDRRKEVCEALGMSFIRVKALRRVAATGPVTMRELAADLSTDAPYTTLVVDDLERRGLVERRVHPTDRRSKTVTVTREGARAALTAEGILGEPPEPLLALGPDDLAELDRLVARLLAADSGRAAPARYDPAPRYDPGARYATAPGVVPRAEYPAATPSE